ncbi:TetR/AcrR family transcriptional regulator [Deinococcus deserti]|uniref:Putative transcriptional regulator, TetR family n=1 Tax=Deinococcus deserti (strain DSM 17065 / CIP 109153 / LMG 22923 / VCD115) TaxID=546414 RepID=E6RGA8_DEIDV|nr:TetR/AcrR family transcriptional regulator [Deinococcus deserti]ADT91189.1 putative transcriptional regulator, TetR family [Deinococcus deserti VCD115]
MLPVPARVDPRVRRTRQAILEALEALLRERPYSSITVHDIAERAGINRATFYAHYREKHELFVQLVEKHFASVLTAHALPPGKVFIQDVRRLFQGVCVFLAQVHLDRRAHPCEMDAQVDLQVQRQLNTLVSDALRGSEQRCNSRRISRDMTATLMASGIYSSATAWAIQSPPPPLEAYIEEAMVFLSAGLLATGYVQDPVA